MNTAQPLAPNLQIQPAFNGGAITMTQGKARRFRFQVQDQRTLDPVDVTTWAKFWFLGKQNIADLDGAAIVSKTMGAGIAAVQAVSGLLEVTISPADTSALADAPMHLFAQIQGLDPNGLVWNLWQGELDIQPTIVQATS
jgi:hypothetical protein